MANDTKLQNVLLVDDDDFIQDIYSTKFSEEGISVTTAADGDEALQAIEDHGDFDAILLDIIMPGTDGLELLGIMQDRNLIEDNCIIILSNQGQPEDEDKADEFDIDGYIIKASNVPSEVLAEVKEIYAQSQHE